MKTLSGLKVCLFHPNGRMTGRLEMKNLFRRRGEEKWKERIK